MKQKIFIILLVILSIFIVSIAIMTGLPFKDFYFFIFYFVFLYILMFYSFGVVYPIIVAVCLCHFGTIIYVEGTVFYRLLFWCIQYVILGYFIYFFSKYNEQKNMSMELSFELSIMERISREFLSITHIKDSMRLLINIVKDLTDNVEGIFFNFINADGENEFVFEVIDGVVSEKKLRQCYNELLELVSEVVDKQEYNVEDFLVISDFNKNDEEYKNLVGIKNLVYFPIIVAEEKIGEMITFSMHNELEYSEMELIGTFISRISDTLESLSLMYGENGEIENET